MEEDTKTLALLEAANRSSEQVSVLHIAFMALCAYVLVIVFSTTDMDLLLGKGLKLPVVNTEVLITGFYAFAPYLVVLVHFNLLLQLQLLSRKLYAFDTAVNTVEPSKEGLVGLRDRLHIFPYTYYLVGNPDPIVYHLLGFMVMTTLLLLPLATLLALQLWFLAYQNHAITWAQRVAVWSDVAFMIFLWPVIIDRDDSWCKYMHAVVSRLREWWGIALIWVAVWASFIATWFVSDANVFNLILALFLGLLVLLGLFIIVKAAIGWYQRHYPNSMFLEVPGRGQLPVHGISALLLTIGIGLPLPLVLLVDGEPWESLLGSPTFASSKIYQQYRNLDLKGQLLVKSAKPEIIMQLRENRDNPEELKKALNQVEGIYLEKRSLRHAIFSRVVLTGANLKEAHLEDAKLAHAHLEGAKLAGAYLQGANLEDAKLQDARFWSADLRGANLSFARLRDARLRSADLRGANLYSAQLQGADLEDTQLQGANLKDAKLQDAKLVDAHLQGIFWAGAQLYGITLKGDTESLIDLRLIEYLPTIDFCLKCKQQWLPEAIEAFRSKLHLILRDLACGEPPVARGLIKQIYFEERLSQSDSSESNMGSNCQSIDLQSSRFGLAERFESMLNKLECKGLYSLSEDDKNLIHSCAKREYELKWNR